MRHVKIAISAALLILVISGTTLGALAISSKAANQSQGTSSRATKGPPLSEAALFSAFAERNNLVSPDLPQLTNHESDDHEHSDNTGIVDNNPNRRAHDEPAVAVGLNEHSGPLVGANDYGIGIPVGGGVYFTTGEEGRFTDYFPPFPLLAATSKGGTILFVEPPAGTGDPALAFSTTRASGSTPAGLPVAYYTSLGFSASFCENGVFIFRSLNGGQTWTRPIVPPFAPPKGLRTVVYWPFAFDCTVFNDKSFLTVDNTGGVHNGRVYVTWTQFVFDTSFNFIRSPIMLAFSDDNGQTFSAPEEISGTSATLCANPFNPANTGICNENQFSVPVVAKDGTLIVAFENEEFNGAADGFRDQYLVTKVNPDTFAVSGPFKVNPGTPGGTIIDGLFDYPTNNPTDFRQTLCNSNFRVNSAGNIAIGPSGTGGAPPGVQPLYVVWSDNRAGSSFPTFPTFVTAQPNFSCPSGKTTNTEVFLSKSVDGGASWTFAGVVGKAPGSTKNDHWFPWVAVDQKKGTVFVVSYDRSADPNNRAANTVLSSSNNGGASWKTKVVSAFASDFTFAFFGSGRFIGDYNNLAVTSEGKPVAVWTGFVSFPPDTDIFIFTGDSGD